MATRSQIKAAGAAMRKHMLDGCKLAPVAYWEAMARVGLKAAAALPDPARPDALIGCKVSVDVSIDDDTAGDRIFAEVVDLQPGPDGRTELLCEFRDDNRAVRASGQCEDKK